MESPTQAEEPRAPADEPKPAGVMRLLRWPYDHPAGTVLLLLLHAAGLWALSELDTYGHLPVPVAAAGWAWVLLSARGVYRYWPAAPHN